MARDPTWQLQRRVLVPCLLIRPEPRGGHDARPPDPLEDAHRAAP